MQITDNSVPKIKVKNAQNNKTSQINLNNMELKFVLSLVPLAEYNPSQPFYIYKNEIQARTAGSSKVSLEFIIYNFVKLKIEIIIHFLQSKEKRCDIS